MIVGVNSTANTHIRTKEDLMQSIGDASAGDEVHLQVLRGGQEVRSDGQAQRPPALGAAAAAPVCATRRVPFISTPPKTTDDEIRDRQHKADEFWDQEFAPLLDDGMV